MDAVPIVSVIIPCHGDVPYLPAALESVFRQTPHTEILLVDDGPDGNVEREAAPYRQKIRYFARPCGGPAAARNTALQQARGKYVLFLDADDVLMPCMLERLLAEFRRRPTAAVIYCGCMLTNAMGSNSGWIQYAAKEGDLGPILRFSNVFPIHAALCRTEAVRNAGAFDEALTACEDWDLWNRMARQGVRFAGVPDVLVKYRLRGHSNSLDPHRNFVCGRRVIQTYAEEGQYDVPVFRWAAWCAGAALGMERREEAAAVFTEGRCDLPSVRDISEIAVALMSGWCVAKAHVGNACLRWAASRKPTLSFLDSMHLNLTTRRNVTWPRMSLVDIQVWLYCLRSMVRNVLPGSWRRLASVPSCVPIEMAKGAASQS